MAAIKTRKRRTLEEIKERANFSVNKIGAQGFSYRNGRIIAFGDGSDRTARSISTEPVDGRAYRLICTLGKLMEEKGISQKDLADATGIRQSTVNYYVHNKRTYFDRCVIEKLAEFFGCELTDLLELVAAEGSESSLGVSLKEWRASRPDSSSSKTHSAYELMLGLDLTERELIIVLGRMANRPYDEISGFTGVGVSRQRVQQIEANIESRLHQKRRARA